jgi:hypothetical protein
MQDAFLPLRGFLVSYLARLEKDFSFNWIAQEENLGLLYDLTEKDNCCHISFLQPSFSKSGPNARAILEGRTIVLWRERRSNIETHGKVVM